MPALYDDGGIFGSTMVHPALQRLLDDIRARRIDLIVIDKVDRLTRSLADFAKLVDVFSAHEVSFVAVDAVSGEPVSCPPTTLRVVHLSGGSASSAYWPFAGAFPDNEVLPWLTAGLHLSFFRKGQQGQRIKRRSRPFAVV